MQIKQLKYPSDWKVRKELKKTISVVTAYDASSALLASRSNVDALLVGDSLGTTIQKKRSTIPVTLDEIIYHAWMVRRGAPDRFIIGDLPFGSYQTSERDGILSSARLMKEGEVDAVKLEGGDERTAELIRHLVRSGIPVMGHIGLTPQSYLTLGGYRVQGRNENDAIRLIEEAKRLEEAGCFALLLEYVSRPVTKKITETVSIPTIGIGSGEFASGQVLVWHDLLGLDPDFAPKHARQYANLASTIVDALNRYDDEVKTGGFPAAENGFE